MTKKPIVVSIIGAPIACKEGIKDTWRDVAMWAGEQLKDWFGDGVEVQYFDLFDMDCPAIPQNSQLPVVMVEGDLVSSGGKISVPLIRKKIEALVANQ